VPVLAFAFAAAALGTAAFLGAATLRLRGASFAIGAYLLAWAAVVGLGEILSLLDAVGRPGYVLGAAVVLVASVCAWHLRDRPLPPLPRLGLTVVRQHPQLAALGAVVLAALVYQAFLVVATPPNNYDSLTYHLARVAAWLQQGHVGYYDAATARANAFPGNAELGILATVALLGRDTLAALPQLLAELGVLACVYGIGRRLGFGRPSAAFAALLTATLSQVALQSVTTQNDLVAASFVAAAMFFVLGRERRELPLAGLAAALAVGTKLTGVLALPLLVLAAVLLLPRRRIVELAAAGAVAFLGFGAFWYVENAVRTDHPLGVVPEADSFRADHSAGAVASTAAKVSWRFVDFTGLKAPDELLTGLSSAGAGLFEVAHVDPDTHNATALAYSFKPRTASSEDTSYFGPLGFLLLLPLSAGFLLAWSRRRVSRAQGALAAALPLFVLAIALTQSYNNWLGRFMLIPAALVMPLAAWLYDRRLRLLTLVAGFVGAATLVGTHTHNIAKPVGLSGTTPVWSLPRATAQTLTAGPFACALRLVAGTVPADGPLGVVLGTNDPSYLLYGPKLGRRLVRLPTHGAVRSADAKGLRWVLVSPDAGSIPVGSWHVQKASGGWQFLTRPSVAQPVSAKVDEGCRPAGLRHLAAS
jgi:4-amino-4-deoxy-L-arabinose transferase-like glycosyltransferase